MTSLSHERLCRSYPTAPYPGEVPQGSFAISNGRVREIHKHERFLALPDGQPLRTFLESQGSWPRMIPLLAYGSNACPGRLAEKFGDGPGLNGIALIAVRMRGAVRCWSRNINSRGAVPATLAPDESQTAPAHVLLLPHRYEQRMDQTEGRSGRYYAAVRLKSTVVALPNGTQWREPLT